MSIQAHRFDHYHVKCDKCKKDIQVDDEKYPVKYKDNLRQDSDTYKSIPDLNDWQVTESNQIYCPDCKEVPDRTIVDIFCNFIQQAFGPHFFWIRYQLNGDPQDIPSIYYFAINKDSEGVTLEIVHENINGAWLHQRFSYSEGWIIQPKNTFTYDIDKMLITIMKHAYPSN